eukprot:gene8190-5716_t
MLDTVAIVTFGGAVLWIRNASADVDRRYLINQLIRDVFMEDRAGQRGYVYKDYKMMWSLRNDEKLFAVAVFSKFTAFQSLDLFLKDVSAAFAQRFPQAAGSMRLTEEALAPFDAAFDHLWAKFERSESLHPSDGPSPLVAEDEAEDEAEGEQLGQGEQQTRAEPAGTEAVASPSAGPTTNTKGQVKGNVLVTKDGRRLVGRRRGGPGRWAADETQEAAADSPTHTSVGKKKAAKAPTRWDDRRGGVVDEAAELQQHSAGPSEEELSAQAELQKAVYIKRLANGSIAPVREKEWDGEGSRGRLASWLRSYVGGSRDLDEGDLAKVLPNLREKLIGKNVSVEVAEDVCASVEASLKGKKLGTFESIYTVIDKAMVSSLRRILQPKHEINILRDVEASKRLKKPYVIVFCGVNGVGKSTSLAKIAYWLQQNNHTVLIAAGDTFRHGAVEQLQVHGRCLGAEVYQQGYGTDPSAVAAAAVSAAARQHIDVVMVDTAGRQQNHASRMRALAKLIHDNQPDLVLFVGEALVGNNGVDQLRRFNQCLVDYAPVGSACRGIDGIVLTKFDTMDDKVGAAVSMVYELGQPIVFVGVGQTYQDLKVIEPDVVVSALMK